MKRAARKAKLTELHLKAKPEADRTYLIWDTERPGLCVSVRPNGRATFKFIYSRGGRSRWYTIGDAKAIGVSKGRSIARELAGRVAEGKDPQAEKKAERGAGTFAELHQRYLEEHAKKRNKSWEQAAKLVDRFLLPKWGKLQVGEINRADVKALV